MKGLYVDLNMLSKSVEYGLAKEFNMLVSLISCRNYIKKDSNPNQTRECNTWKDVMDALEITNKNKRSKMRKMLVDNDIIRQSNKFNSKEKVMVFNPNIVRYGSHISPVSVAVFKDVCLESIHKYCSYMLYANGMIDLCDIS